MSKQRIWICVIVALAGLISLYFYSTSDMRWDLVSKQFMKSENNYVYDARNFRIHENEMISLRFIDRWDKSKATIHVGSIENSKQTFSEKAQDGTWWLSPDWEVIYLSTRRFDEDTDSSSSRNNRTTQTNKLWKSTDGGHHWERLAWPKQQRIKAIHFLNEQEGFAIPIFGIQITVARIGVILSFLSKLTALTPVKHSTQRLSIKTTPFIWLLHL